MPIEPLTIVVSVIGAYGVGSLPFSYWVVLWTKGIDVRSVGSGNPGATNVLRAAGKAAALSALGLDALKGVLPVVVAAAIWPQTTAPSWAALGAVCGHAFSLLLRFRGGKGVATAAGALGALSPAALGIGAVVFAGVLAATRYVSLASICAAVSLPVAIWFLATEPEPGALVPAALVSLLIVVRHHANIARLVAGNESRLGSRGSKDQGERE
ncbi:MAG: glycerol-3-phosphate 1-O-acyltransferase PlsY [Acidobacteriota bacterium]|nr:glycerol-3-phosphate 1-O-acyltransferase PlsY [Acidobacteriota bacterium]